MQKTQKCRPFDSRLLAYCSTEQQKRVYIAYGENGSVVNATARALQMPASDVSNYIRRIQDKGHKYGKLEADEIGQIRQVELNILLFDIETAPHLVWTYDLWGVNIGHDQVESYGHVLSYAARWMGTDKVIYQECRDGNDKDLTQSLMDLFDKADVVIGHNGKAFDVKTMKGRALAHGLKPPKPYKIVDTFLIAKQEFKLARNSLEYIADALGCTPKMKHTKYPGFKLFIECKRGNEDAWKELKKYNIQDIDTLEEVYIKMRAWATNHPNLGVFFEEYRSVCPKCGSGELERISPIRTNTQVYEGYRCSNCGGLCRGTRTIAPIQRRRTMTTQAV